MFKNKIILSIGASLLFLGLALSPVTANESTEQLTTVDYTIVSNDGTYKTSTIKLTEQDLDKLDGIITDLLEKLQSVKDGKSFDNLLKEYLSSSSGGSPLIQIIFQILKIRFQMKKQRNDFIKKVSAPRRALIVSHGISLKTPFSGENKIKLVKPFVTWAYYNKKASCRTTIIDPVPFKSKTLTGRQIGFMRGFTGLYIFKRGQMSGKANTFFIGYGGLVRGLDLSPSIISN